jgi:transposase
VDDGQLAELKGLLRSKDYWETREVRELIETTWGVTLSPSQVARILKGKLRMHFSKPYPRDYRRPEDAESRLRESLDAAYRKLSQRGVATDRVAIGCLDESSPQTTSNRVRLWHFEHPRFIKNTDRMKSNTIGFYAITGTSVHDFMADSTAPSIADFLERVRDANREFDAVIIVLDLFPSHRARLVRERAEAHRMELVYLPAYSPDINPIEFIWKTVKRAVSVTCVHTLTDLRDVISAAWNQAACQPTYARAWTEKFLESRD